MPNLTAVCRQHLPDAVSLLKQLLAIESPSTDKAAVDRCTAYVASVFGALQLQTERVSIDNAGDHLLVESPGRDAARILIMLHLDTVWSLGTLAEMPIREDNGLLYGPGAYDMKASVAIVWLALRALQESGRSPRRTLRFLFTSDEEVGSLTSEQLIKEEAARSDLVLVMEPALNNGRIKTARKGTGQFSVTAHGRSSHAGGSHEKGVNAIEEIARHVLSIQRLTDYARGTTVNVGEIRGGTRVNVVPERAEIMVDYRVESMEEAERIEKTFHALKPLNPKARLEVSGGLNRPPMVRDATMRATFNQARKIAAQLGIDLKQGSTGGASDGNFTAALGIPTLDGMGPVGEGAHARHENIVINSVAERAALLASIWLEWE